MGMRQTNSMNHGKNHWKARWVLAPVAMGLLALSVGCRQDMQNQPKMIPQRGSRFFADHRSVRPQVLNTVARGQLEANEYFYTGMINNKEQDDLPFPATMTVLKRGQERFNIYCAPCHSRVGNGRGMIVERGYKPAGDLLAPRILHEPVGHYFSVMTNGYGAMPDYASQITPEDRWAIAAYIRALQLSQNAKPQDVPEGTSPQTLAEVSEGLGYGANFEQEWTLPAATNVPSAGDMKVTPGSTVPPGTLLNQGAGTPGAAGQNSPQNSPKTRANTRTR